MLLLLIIALLPAMIGSAAGHVAACRAFLMTMVVPLFAGVGFAFVRRHHVRPSLAPLWLAASVLVPVSGTVLFDVVNPSVLSSSAQALTADLLGDRDPATHAVVLDSRVDVHGRALTWLRLREVAERLPRTPLATRSYIDDQSLLDMPGDPPIDIFAWSPALEADRRVGEGMCTRFPEARLFVVTDGARRSRLLVAAPRSRDWSPALPPHRWVRLDCPQLAASGWPSLGPLPREIRLRIVGNQLRDMAR